LASVTDPRDALICQTVAIIVCVIAGLLWITFQDTLSSILDTGHTTGRGTALEKGAGFTHSSVVVRCTQDKPLVYGAIAVIVDVVTILDHGIGHDHGRPFAIKTGAVGEASFWRRLTPTRPHQTNANPRAAYLLVIGQTRRTLLIDDAITVIVQVIGQFDLIGEGLEHTDDRSIIPTLGNALTHALAALISKTQILV